MPAFRFQVGDTVMGRWPGSNLYYEVKVLSHSSKTQLYTVIYKDGTELELKDADIKSLAGFKQRSGRSRSRSRSTSPARTRRGRSRSPARTPRNSTSRNAETVRDKLKEVLEVRLTPIAMPVLNNSNNKHENNEEKYEVNSVTENGEKEPENQVSVRYNLRRRRDIGQGDEPVVEVEKKTEVIQSQPTPLLTSKTTELEFGGRIGVMFWVLLLPVMVLALLILCRQKDASLSSFPLMLPPLESLWDWQVFGIVLLWLLFQAVLSLLPIGKVVDGMPLKNKVLKYRINGFCALLISGLAVGAAVHYGLDFTYIHAHFLQFYLSALLVSTLLSIYLFIRSRWASDDERAPAGNSGYVIYDFFMGCELNPRIKNFDIKFFCEMRPGLIGWVVINFAMLMTEMKLQNRDAPSTAMLLVNIFQLLWVADGLWHEEKLLSMMDIVYDGFGFMLAFGDLAWVPFTFTCQSYYLATHPSDLSVFWIIAIILMNAIGYYIFRKANSEKYYFRRNPYSLSLSHLKTIPTGTGKNLIASGLWGFVRHPNYLGDIIMAVAWSLSCGFNHVIPYFYLFYLILLLVHREARDEHQCRKKYGSAWEEYCKTVPYRIFPGIY
ncbi:delta(14)-sterol reductase LBR [Trichomycterus rosablanca]|uniref:delta(14)-sterol reductase LBR n=1 Tax=Trichomycterus rosablanca TaxID=2290929 RepID=UPI002F360909